MHINKIWKKQLLGCIVFFFAMLVVGYLLKNGVILLLGMGVMGVSAVIAEWFLRCPACRESLFKQAMERGAKEFSCPKCGQTITLE